MQVGSMEHKAVQGSYRSEYLDANTSGTDRIQAATLTTFIGFTTNGWPIYFQYKSGLRISFVLSKIAVSKNRENRAARRIPVSNPRWSHCRSKCIREMAIAIMMHREVPQLREYVDHD